MQQKNWVLKSCRFMKLLLSHPYTERTERLVHFHIKDSQACTSFSVIIFFIISFQVLDLDLSSIRGELLSSSQNTALLFSRRAQGASVTILRENWHVLETPLRVLSAN